MWKRWFEDFDPWSPRPIDHAVAALLVLVLVIAYVGERNHAVDLQRRIFAAEERIMTLRSRTELLRSKATSLGTRERIVPRAQRDFGMVLGEPEQIHYIYYVPETAGAPRPPAPPATTRWGRPGVGVPQP